MVKHGGPCGLNGHCAAFILGLNPTFDNTSCNIQIIVLNLDVFCFRFVYVYIVSRSTGYISSGRI